MNKTRKRAPKVALSHLDESDLSDESVSYLCFFLSPVSYFFFAVGVSSVCEK